MIVNVLCYDFWDEVRCELVVGRMNVCDMEVVVVECCGVNGGEVTMVGDLVGVWVA